MLTPEQTDKIIDGFFRLATVVVGPLVGAVIGWVVSTQTMKRTETRKLTRQLETLKLTIYTKGKVNDLKAELFKLKSFFLENPELLAKHKVNSSFFNTWLQDPFLEIGPAAGMWDKEKLDKLRRDIKTLKV